VKCPICLQSFPTLHCHHIIPTGYGGRKDGKTVGLCSSCHNAIHAQAESICANTRKTHLDNENLGRAKKLIRIICTAKTTQLNIKGGNRKKKVVLHVDQSLLIGLHRLKTDQGFKSLEKFVISKLKSLF